MFWIAQVVAVSFVIIFILHNLYFFFKETLTVPKMKDMVRRPQQRYDTLFRELRMHNEAPSGNEFNGNGNNNNNYNNYNGNNNGNNDNDNDNNNNGNNNDAMKNELKRYLMELNAPIIEPQPHPQSNSNYIELGSVYQ
jgi:hypothetical protein